jgi:hypothetical protein
MQSRRWRCSGPEESHERATLLGPNTRPRHGVSSPACGGERGGHATHTVAYGVGGAPPPPPPPRRGPPPPGPVAGRVSTIPETIPETLNEGC